VETAVASRRDLAIVGDLANACKHKVRSRSNRTGAYAVSSELTIELGARKPIDVHYVIETDDGEQIDAHTLAGRAMDAWIAALEELGLGR
jgi:hypothetical protein